MADRFSLRAHAILQAVLWVCVDEAITDPAGGANPRIELDPYHNTQRRLGVLLVEFVQDIESVFNAVVGNVTTALEDGVDESFVVFEHVEARVRSDDKLLASLGPVNLVQAWALKYY